MRLSCRCLATKNAEIRAKAANKMNAMKNGRKLVLDSSLMLSSFGFRDLGSFGGVSEVDSE